MSFNKVYREMMLEYRHNLADGTPAPSLEAHKGKNPNRINKKILHTVGPRKKNNEKLNSLGAVISFNELLAMGHTFKSLSEILNSNDPFIRNKKNSKSDIQLFSPLPNQICGRVIKASPANAK